MAAPPGVLVLVNETSTLPFTGTERLSVPPSVVALPCALMLKCAVGPDCGNSTLTCPVAVELAPLLSVTISVTVLLADENERAHVDELPHTGVPPLFHAQLVAVVPGATIVELPSKLTCTVVFTAAVRLKTAPSVADLPWPDIVK